MQRRICFLHPSGKTLQQTLEALRIVLPDGCEFVLDDNNPEIVFCSEMIYYDESSFNKFSYYYRHLKNTIYVFFSGECISPDLNIFDYAISYDSNLKYYDRIYRIPAIIYHKKSMFCNENTLTKDAARNILDAKNKKFCCFIYSNPNGHWMRDMLFKKISEYKFVESLGKHLKNTEITTNIADWRKESMLLKSNYKFSIAAENSVFTGYTSEKLLTSFQSFSVPIYWGNPKVSEEFNENAFINVHNMKSFEELLATIKQIDEDDELWCKIMTEPWQTQKQQEASKRQYEKYNKFILKLFNQNIDELLRRPFGCTPSNYLHFVLRQPHAMFRWIC